MILHGFGKKSGYGVQNLTFKGFQGFSWSQHLSLLAQAFVTCGVDCLHMLVLGCKCLVQRCSKVYEQWLSNVSTMTSA